MSLNNPGFWSQVSQVDVNGNPLALVIKTFNVQAITAAAPVNIWTPAAGKKFRLLGFAFSLSVAGRILLIDNAATIIVTPQQAADIAHVSPLLSPGYLSAAINQILKVDVSATGNVSGYVFGTEE